MHTWAPLPIAMLLVAAGCTGGPDAEVAETDTDDANGTATSAGTSTSSSASASTGTEHPSDADSGDSSSSSDSSDSSTSRGESEAESRGESSDSSSGDPREEGATADGSTGADVSCGTLTEVTQIELTPPEQQELDPFDWIDVAASSAAENGDWSGSCTASASRQILALTAPRSGWYTFSPVGGIRTLAVIDCGEQELGCVGEADSTAMISVELTEGQTVAVVAELEAENGRFSVFQGDLHCARAEFDAVPATFEEFITPAVDEFDLSCADGPEVATLFTAPVAGTYVVDAESGLPFVLRGVCRGEEAVCAESRRPIEVTLDAGETVTVGATVARFPDRHALHITRIEGECIDQEIESSSLPAMITGTTAGAGNTGYSRCGGASAEDRTYRFTAEVSGTYFFNTSGSEIETVLTLRDDTCTGEVLDCENASTPEGLTVELAAGESVAVTVDGQSVDDVGAYRLNVESVACAPMPLEAPARVEGSTAGEPNRFRPSCESATMGAENVYAFTAPMDATYMFTLAGAGDYVTLALYEGPSCDGAELECERRTWLDDSGAEVSLSVSLTSGEVVLVVVEGLEYGVQDYTLDVGVLPAP